MEKFTKEIMKQYEKVRRSGITNMFDYNGVIRAAFQLECYNLGSMTFEEYKCLLMNFNKLMKKYDIKQK